VLRELRGGRHLIATLASGLTPLQSVLIGGSPRNSGPDQAREFGWPEPYEQIGPDLRDRWTAAEALTDELSAPDFAVLDEKEGKELATLLTEVNETIYSRR
jgi:hypothetical protein